MRSKKMLISWFWMKNFWPVFVAHCESCVQDIKIVVLEIRVSMSFLRVKKKEKLYCRTLYFSLRIVKSLQPRGCKQIPEPRKFCLVCDYFSLVYIFLYFCISQVWEFRTYSHQLVSEPRVRFEWEQWQRKQEWHLE